MDAPSNADLRVESNEERLFREGMQWRLAAVMYAHEAAEAALQATQLRHAVEAAAAALAGVREPDHKDVAEREAVTPVVHESLPVPSTVPAAPIKTWRAVADACGVSVWTVKRAREAAGDTSRPCFPSGQAAQDWFRHLPRSPDEPAPQKSSRRRSKEAVLGGAVDLRKVRL